MRSSRKRGATMVDSKDIKNKFVTLQEYEAFHNEWARACYLLNPTEKNKERLEYSEKVLAVLNAQKESKEDD